MSFGRMDKITDHYDDVGKGWHDLLTQAHKEIQAADPEYTVLQVKEKFGGLRLYLSGHDIYGIARKYENQSYQICEECGKPGRPNDQSEYFWILTLCDEHRAEREKEKTLRRSDLEKDV